MSKSIFYIFLLSVFAFGIPLVGQAQVRIEVQVKAALPAPDKPLYLAADFNNWNPGNPEYALTQHPDGTYSIVLDHVPDRFAYKFTQGTWTLVEGSAAGEPFTNRIYSRSADSTSTIQVTIEGWENGYTFVVRQLPEKTPHDANLYITGNFNNWNPGDRNFKLEKKVDGTYQVKVYTELDRIEYKFTRGNWESVEARESGKALPNRVFFPNATTNDNTIQVDIAGWEDMMGTLHFFSLYDLLLLFSVFQGILLIVAIPSIHSYNREANRWLMITLGLSSLMILLYLMSNYQVFVNVSPKLILLPDFILFVYAPLFYFYLLKLLFNVKRLPSRWYLHFIPFLIQFFVYLPYLLRSDKVFLLNLMNQEADILLLFITFGFLGLLWNGYYWLLFRRTLNTYRADFQTNLSYDQNLQYLNTVGILQFVCLCLWGFMYVLLAAHWLFDVDLTSLIESSVDVIWLAFSIIPYFVGYFAIHQPETFKAAPRPLSIFDDVLDTSVGQSMLKEVKADTDPIEEKENLAPHIEKLEKHMDANKPYVNPKLSLAELAGQVDMPSHLLSRIINEHFEKNFFDFINSYRIEEFKRLINDPRNHNLTFLSLAYEVGFNSKTAFNRSFKKITNQTPREYFESVTNG
ncbi:helix-turn-helix domain-containing protein [Telluribacter sp. SYSU D00476]|uniref:helix-turn-helix domain-containing protein n=1 Tax=Telluribacter sp. SYSU D00476 TaxID=2811430 RepID=UPI001FF3B8F9|nr:helix-turn-helix domain-containing protein [Telluribacter sp. SYSU D00476]